MYEPGVLSSIFDRHSMVTGTLEPEPTTLETNKLWKSSGVFRIRKFKRTEGDILLTVQGLEKRYQQGNRTLNILQKLNLRLRGGEITALVGPSGSGKSTLLHILGLLDTPTGGQIIIGDQIVGKMNDSARTRLRNKSIGFVYQFHHLLPEFTALENVAMPLIIGGTNMREAKDRAEEYLKAMGLAERVKHRPAELSGGEQQRVAIARALVNQPKLLFADEPTGNLDPETSQEVFEILMEQVRSRGIGALIATHNIALAEEMDRILELKGGKLVPY
jgi:lipoprotein-releasing system ATP-binding protein